MRLLRIMKMLTERTVTIPTYICNLVVTINSFLFSLDKPVFNFLFNFEGENSISKFSKYETDFRWCQVLDHYMMNENVFTHCYITPEWFRRSAHSYLKLKIFLFYWKIVEEAYLSKFDRMLPYILNYMSLTLPCPVLKAINTEITSDWNESRTGFRTNNK